MAKNYKTAVILDPLDDNHDEVAHLVTSLDNDEATICGVWVDRHQGWGFADLLSPWPLCLTCAMNAE